MATFFVSLVSLCATAATIRPYPTGAYDAVAARAFFARQPLRVASRAVEISLRGASFGIALLGDKLSGESFEGGDRALERGRQLTKLLTDLGPAFIKLGQSASVRADLLPPPFVIALTSLQEDVPPFSSVEALQILEQELGAEARRLTGLSREPIAAASLGQVYRATYEGAPVAVKVQRPAIEERVALDMHLVREYVAPLARLLGAPGDLQGIADAWGAGLVDELDYSKEASNAMRFNEDVARGPLAGSVFAPNVIGSVSTRRVLTTEWVEGERLDRVASGARDSTRMVSLAMASYMTMMLDHGTLHCDPHPGNLLRTPDGRLCILDWGLTTALDDDLQYTLIEHVAHLTSREYDKVPNDLVRLGFVPEGGEAAVEEAGVVDLLTRAYSKRSEGGGFANFDVPGLLAEVQQLSADAGSAIFQIPPYFAYIAKAFATLEGIGLKADARYSIINETLPYISQRILNDPSPRTAGALATFVFGASKDDPTTRVLDADRVRSLLDGAKRYDVTAATVSSGAEIAPGTESLPAEVAAAERAADALLAVLKEDTPASRLITEQLILVLGAASRDAWAGLRAQSGAMPAVAGQRSRLGALVDPLGIFRGSALVTNDARDKAALEAARRLAALAPELLGAVADEGGGASGVTPPDQQLLATALLRKAWQRREDLQQVFLRLALEATDQTVARLMAGRARW
jgi:predicted unusual protein kinase regulating ubiquinone biosynthesis (AarF/ABC1/UbiB family)